VTVVMEFVVLDWSCRGLRIEAVKLRLQLHVIALLIDLKVLAPKNHSQ
jgi:hypothetical protein